MPAHTFDRNAAQTTSTPEAVEITAGTAAPRPAEWQMLTFTSLNDAHEMLDSLEAQGIVEREFVVLGKSHFAVKWR